MSFEFYGGLLALKLLQEEYQAPQAQSESVVEAIIRHQDLGESGKITTLGLLLQLATIFGTSNHLGLQSLQVSQGQTILQHSRAISMLIYYR